MTESARPATGRSAGTLPASRLLRLAPLVVAGVAIACYANSLEGTLLFDDLNAIVNNRFVRECDIGRILTTASWWGELSYGRLYRPVTTLSFAANYLLGGTNPAGYHLVNILLHAGVSLLLLRLVSQLWARPLLSFLSALLFAAHPVHTEAVTSVVGRAEELAALFALACWLLLLKSRRAKARPLPWLLAASLSLAVGFLAKESAGTILLAIICSDLIRSRAECGRASVAFRRWFPQYAVLSVALVAVVSLRTLMLGRVTAAAEMMDNVLAGAPLVARYLTATAVVGWYAARLVWPFKLSADYSYPQIELVNSPLDPAFAAGLAVIAVAVLLIAWGIRHKSFAAVAVTFALSTFALASNMVVTIGTIMAERLLYLPSAGFCCLAAGAVEGAARRLFHEPGRARTSALLGIALITIVWGGATWRRNQVWRNPRVFFETMVKDAPRSARSHRELGLVYSRMGRHDEALAEMQRSLALKPADPTTLYNLGNVLMRAHRYREAIAAYTRALARKPDFVQAMTNLGNAYSAAGDEMSAQRWFESGLRLSPRSAALNMNLANSLFRQGRGREAEERYRMALALNPRAANVHRNYGSFLYASGRYKESAEEYRRAVALAPGSPSAYVGLAAALASGGRYEEARRVQARAESLFPADPGVLRMKQTLERQRGSSSGTSKETASS